MDARSPSTIDERAMIDAHLDYAALFFWQTARNSLGGDFLAPVNHTGPNVSDGEKARSPRAKLASADARGRCLAHLRRFFFCVVQKPPLA